MTLQRRRFLQIASAAAAARPLSALAAPPLRLRIGSGPGLAAVQTYYATGDRDVQTPRPRGRA